MISGNYLGIETHNPGNLVTNNWIGTDIRGTVALVNGSYGVIVFSSCNTIGGTTAGAGNVISGNTIWTTDEGPNHDERPT